MTSHHLDTHCTRCPSQSFEATQADFPLPTLGPLLLSIAEDCKRGRGFGVLRGLPVQRWTRIQVRTRASGSCF